jgi:hypothetical protein
MKETIKTNIEKQPNNTYYLVLFLSICLMLCGRSWCVHRILPKVRVHHEYAHVEVCQQ